jgi:adenine deaminase
VVCENGKILSELPLPVFGIISDLPLETIDQRFKDVAIAAKNLGSPFPEPMLSLITLTGAAIPYLRICEQGLVNLKDGKNVSLFVN